MVDRTLTYETNGASIGNVQVEGKPISELPRAELEDLVISLIWTGLAIRERLGSPGFERRNWFAKPPEERKPGAEMIDRGGVR